MEASKLLKISGLFCANFLLAISSQADTLSLLSKKDGTLQSKSSSTLEAKYKKNNRNNNSAANPDSKLVKVPEESYVLIPELNFEFRNGLASFFQSRITGAFEHDQTSDLYISEAYIKHLSGRMSIIAGKYLSPLGTSYFDNPADLLLENNESNELSDSAGSSYKTGNFMLRVGYAWDGLNAELTAADYKSKDFFGKHRNESQSMLKLSMDFLDGEGDVALLARGTSGGEMSFGLALSAEAGPDAVAYMQLSAHELERRVEPELAAEAFSVAPGVNVPARYQYIFSDERYFPRHVAGLQFTSPVTKWGVILELYFNGAGLDENEAETMREGLKQSNADDAWESSLYSTAAGNPFAGFMKQTLKLVSEGGLRQRYLKARLSTGDIFSDFQLLPVAIYNIDDGSSLARFEFEQGGAVHVFSASFTSYSGAEDSEFGMYPHQSTFSASLRLMF